MASKYTYVRGKGYIMHDVERVTDDCSKNKFAEVLLNGFPPFEGALYKDANDKLFIQSVDHSFHPNECLFGIEHYIKLGADINIFVKEN